MRARRASCPGTGASGSRGTSISSLPARQARQEKHFAAWRDGLEPGVPVNLPVDGDGDAPVELRLQAGMFLAQAGKQLADIGGLDLHLGRPAGRRLQRPPEDDLDHQRRCAAPMAFRILGGDMGISVIRTLAAADTALATAAKGGTMEVSPTPLSP